MNIALIACSKSKNPEARQHPVAACDLYTGAMFRKSLRYAKDVLRADRIFILSAKYGLVEPEERLPYYDQTLCTAKVAEKRRWADMVITQMAHAGLNTRKDHFVILAGKAYHQYLTGPGRIEHFETPFATLTSIGRILRYLNACLDKC